jgi:hypothetical protein
MEETSKILSPEDSLKLIEKFISNYHKNYRSDSYYFLLWGWVIALASVSHFVILRVLLKLEKYDLINLLSAANWGLFIILGYIILFTHIRRRSINNIIRSHLDKFITTLWQTTGWALLLIVLISLKLGEYPTPFVLSIVGLATFINGRIIQFNPLKWGGIIFFVFAILSAFVINEYQLLVNAVAIILGYIIPGYMLRNSK